MRLLIVGMAGSIHVARYLQLLEGTGWDVHLFASDIGQLHHPETPPVTVYPWQVERAAATEGVRVVESPSKEPSMLDRARYLAELIEGLQPTIVHSHEIQHGAALVRLACERTDMHVPWLVTNWGSDILWYGRDPAHARLIRSVMSACDYYCAECHRDVALARAFGLRGEVIGVWPVAGGVDLDQVKSLRAPGPTSARRAIAVKGGVSAVGQGKHAVTVVERCIDLLEGFEVCGYQMHPSTDERLSGLCSSGGMRYTKLSSHSSRDSAHRELLAMHGRSRISLGLNRSDGLSTSFLEAMAMGSFPVQSSSSCGNELTLQGRGALFVPATDPDAVTLAMRRALTDDELVDDGARLNAKVTTQHLDQRQIRLRIIDSYERIASAAAVDVS